jgi:hypothetical protein
MGGLVSRGAKQFWDSFCVRQPHESVTDFLENSPQQKRGAIA